MAIDKYIKFPNQYIRCDIEKEYGVSKKFYLVYLYIQINRTVFNYSLSHISIEQILKGRVHSKKNVAEIKQILKVMVEQEWIATDSDIDNIKYNTLVTVYINEDKFSPSYNYSTVYYWQIDEILQKADETAKLENLLLVFLYINSYINKKSNRNEFFGSLSDVSNVCGLSKKTVFKYMGILADDLFVKHETGYSNIDKKIRKMPNIYKLKKQQENSEETEK